MKGGFNNQKDIETINGDWDRMTCQSMKTEERRRVGYNMDWTENSAHKLQVSNIFCSLIVLFGRGIFGFSDANVTGNANPPTRPAKLPRNGIATAMKKHPNPNMAVVITRSHHVHDLAGVLSAVAAGWSGQWTSDNRDKDGEWNCNGGADIIDGVGAIDAGLGVIGAELTSSTSPIILSSKGNGTVKGLLE
ncbi:hypothetical protein LguiA_009149 [Lonicera macranthoides]